MSETPDVETHDRRPHAQGDGDTGARVLRMAELRALEEKWSPTELLEQLLADVKAGTVNPTNLMVFFTEEIDGRLRPRTWSANMSHVETIAFCEMEKARVLEDWRS